MLRTKKAERIACVTTALMLLAAACLWGMVKPVQGDGGHIVGYERLLFDQSAVHTIDITMEDWDQLIASATAEEYAQCSVSIDGEKFSNVAIRAKGNTSLSSVASMGSTRYSFKVEFNHFVKEITYHGLDKLSLNNLIQDATMMKDYLAYTLMNRMDVPSSLCSYVQINVNGEPWGLYLAVEGVEDAFLDRNGMAKGELYKPDSLSFGGGRGNGQDFNFDQFKGNGETDNKQTETVDPAAGTPPQTADASPAPETMPQQDGGNGSLGGSSGAPAGMPEMPQGDFNPFSGENAQETPAASDDATASDSEKTQRGFPEMPAGGFNFGRGNDDVKLIYSDDNPDSYSNIFSNAKTTIGKKDQARLIEALRKLNAKEDLENTVKQDEVIRYLAVHNFLCNDDSYTGMMVHNYYLYEEKGKLSIIPWDYNLALGGFSASSDATSTVNSPIDSPVSGGTVDSRPLIAWIFSDENALADYHAAYNRFIVENIESGWLEQEISRVRDMIKPYLEQDSSAFYDMEAFEKAVDTLDTFCQKRGQSIRGQLDGTIPSTSQTQRDDEAALIDASEISTADMGSMNAGGNNFQMPDSATTFPGAEGFTPPSGAPNASSWSGGNSFGGSAGNSAENAHTETSAPEKAQSTAQPAETAAPDTAQKTPDRQNAFSADGAPLTGSATDQSGQWVHLAIWSVILLAALMVIRRAGNHNN